MCTECTMTSPRQRRGSATLLVTTALTLACLTALPVAAAAQVHHQEVAAQTGYIPYYGKNKIRYNNFKWHIYTTDHFEIYYYPEIEQHLERVVELRRERLPAGQLGPQARPRVQGAAHALQDAERVPAAEHRAERAARRRPRVRRAVPRSHGAADRRAGRRALPPDHARADAHLRVRHHPALAAAPRPAAVGRRRPRRLHDGLLEPVRPDDGSRRRDRRHRAADERLPGRRRSSTAACPTTSVTPRSSSSRAAGARKASASSSSRCARTSSAAARAPTRRRSGSRRRSSTSSSRST